jgi:hypothetical protein
VVEVLGRGAREFLREVVEVAAAVREQRGVQHARQHGVAVALVVAAR